MGPRALATEAVVEANGRHVDIAVDLLVTARHAGWALDQPCKCTGPTCARICEADLLASHEQMIVFDAERPSRRKHDVDTSSDDLAESDRRSVIGRIQREVKSWIH